MRLFVFLTLLYCVHGSSNSSLWYTSFQNTTICKPATSLTTPKTTFELQELIKQSKLSHSSLKPIGRCHGSTGIICTDGTPITMKAFSTQRLNEDGSASFGAGITLEAALEFLQLHGKTFESIPMFRKFYYFNDLLCST